MREQGRCWAKARRLHSNPPGCESKKDAGLKPSAYTQTHRGGGSKQERCRAKACPAQTMRKAQQAAPLQGLTAANFINENEKQILRAKPAREEEAGFAQNPRAKRKRASRKTRARRGSGLRAKPARRGSSPRPVEPTGAQKPRGEDAVLASLGMTGRRQIGRASCRERV